MDLSSVLSGLFRNSIPMHFQSTRNQRLSLGSSKFGGIPLLPPGFVWPYYEGESYDGERRNRPLAFLLQINLAELSAFDSDQRLPKTGILSFFYDVETMRWGFSPNDRGCAKVYFHSGEVSEWIPMNPPCDLSPEFHFPELALRFESVASLPDYEEFTEIFPSFGADWNSYLEAQEELEVFCPDDAGEISKLLGYANLIQGDMLHECEQASSGYDCGNGPIACSPEESEALRQRAKDWTLLLQLGTVRGPKNFELLWGDCGCLYFYIRQKDLAEQKFDSCWLILQCS